MEITKELIQTIYTRAEQFAITRWNRGTPDVIGLEDDGTVSLTWEEFDDGYRDTDIEFIDVDDLTADLDSIAAERRRKEEEARLALERERRFREERRLAQEKDRRKSEYLKLKAEFENE